MQGQGLAKSRSLSQFTCLEIAIVINGGPFTTSGCLLTEMTQTSQ